jgi:hypothetical protein
VRTYQEEPYFISSEGQAVLLRLVLNISKHSSSAGYTQGMNNIAAALLFHTSEVIAFELVIRLLNDYHLKEVHMMELPGFRFHCRALECMFQGLMPDLAAHF